MAFPNDLPTRTDESIGRNKVNSGTYSNTSTQADANEYNRLLDNVVGIAGNLGLPTGLTSASAWQAILGGRGGCQYITTTDTVDEHVSLVHVDAGLGDTVTLGDIADGRSRSIMVRVVGNWVELTAAGTGATFIDTEDDDRQTNGGVYLLHGYRVGASLLWHVARIDGADWEAAIAGAVSTTGHTATSILAVDGSGAVVDSTPSTTDRLLTFISGAIAWTQITIGMIADRLITWAKMPAGAAHTLIGRSANSSGDVADIAIGTDEGVFNVAGVLTSQKVQTANIADGAVTGAKIVQSGTIDVGAASFLTTGDITTAGIKSNAGTPEGSVTAGVGAICRDTTNGRLYLKRSGTGNTGWSEVSPSVAGTYTPTGTIVSNLDSVTPSVFQWIRVADSVSVSGYVTVDPTLASTVTILGLSLPVASNFAVASDASGVCQRGEGFVIADYTNDRAQVQYFSGGTAAVGLFVRFSYTVL